MSNRSSRCAALALAAVCALATGCGALLGEYGSMLQVAGDIVSCKCVDGDGDDAGMAYFDRKHGLAMMVLAIGLDLTGRALLVGPLMVGEVFFGRARVVFKIPQAGGQSEVSMFPFNDDGEGGAKARVKVGLCARVVDGSAKLEARSSKRSSTARSGRRPTMSRRMRRLSAARLLVPVEGGLRGLQCGLLRCNILVCP